MKKLTLKQILILHEYEIEKHGGVSGIRDIGMLQSAIGRPFATFGGTDLYHGLLIKAAALIHSIVKNHPFIDGNKRTAYVSAVSLLRLNGYDFVASQNDTVKFMVKVANENISVDQITSWLKKHSKARI